MEKERLLHATAVLTSHTDVWLVQNRQPAGDRLSSTINEEKVSLLKEQEEFADGASPKLAATREKHDQTCAMAGLETARWDLPVEMSFVEHCAVLAGCRW